MVANSVILLGNKLKSESIGRWLVLDQLHTRLHDGIFGGGCIHQLDTALRRAAKRRSRTILTYDQIDNYILSPH